MSERALLEAVTKIASTTGSLFSIHHELDQEVEFKKAKQGTDISKASADDCLVIQAALHFCSHDASNLSPSTDSFSELGYAHILAHCARDRDDCSDQYCLLSDNARITVHKLLEHAHSSSNCGTVINFAKVLNSCNPCPLELLCRLHAAGVLHIEDYIALNVHNPQVIAELSRSLFTSCQLSGQNEAAMFTFSAFTFVLVGISYSGPHCRRASKAVQKVCHAVLEKLLQRLLKLNEENQNLLCGNLLSPLLKNSVMSGTVLRSFALELFSSMLSFDPMHKVSQAMSDHHKWSHKSCSPWLLGMFQKIMQILTSEEVTEQLSKALHNREVNWYMLLTALSVYLSCHRDSCCLTGLIERMLKNAFQTLNAENLVSAFLLARHAAQEAPKFFPPYASWFEKYFGFPDTTYANSSKTFAFLVKFLIDMAPFEQAKYLKAHLQKPAYATAKCRPLYQDYVVLARTRLQDLDVSGHQGVLASGDAEEMVTLKDEVGKALDSFQATGKVPGSIMELSVFKKPFFTGQLLPILLDHKNFLDRREVVSGMVQALFQYGKISKAHYEKFTFSNERHQNKGGKADVHMEANLTPLQSLLAEAKSKREKNDDCKDTVLKAINELRTLHHPENHLANFTWNLEHEPQQFGDASALLHFLMDCDSQDTPSWIDAILLSLASEEPTLWLLAVFLWKLLISGKMEESSRRFFSRSLLHMTLASEEKPLRVSVRETVYNSFVQAMFSALPISTQEERTYFLKIASTYLVLVAEVAPTNCIPLTPVVLLKKFKYIVHRGKDVPLIQGKDYATYHICEESPINDWLQSAKLSISEWVDMESNISDDFNSISPAMLRCDYMELVKDNADVRCMCLCILRALTFRCPAASNSAQLLILLQGLFLNLVPVLPSEGNPFVTEALTGVAERTDILVDHAEKALKFFRIYCQLPSYCLLVNRPDYCPTSESVALFTSLINKFLIFCNGEKSPGLTLHLFKGLLQSNLSKAQMRTILEECPLLTQRLVFHWKYIAPVLVAESKKCEELAKLFASIAKTSSHAEKCIHGSVNAGTKLCTGHNPWLPGLALAHSISLLKAVPQHYASLKQPVQDATIQFLLMLFSKQEVMSDCTVQKQLLELLKANPRLCTSLDPANFETDLLKKLMPPLDAFLCTLTCFRFLVCFLEHQNVKESCCINTALLVMTKIHITNEDLLCTEHPPGKLEAESTWTVISASAQFLSVLRALPQVTRKQIPKATLMNCPMYVQQLFDDA